MPLGFPGDFNYTFTLLVVKVMLSCLLLLFPCAVAYEFCVWFYVVFNVKCYFSYMRFEQLPGNDTTWFTFDILRIEHDVTLCCLLTWYIFKKWLLIKYSGAMLQFLKVVYVFVFFKAMFWQFFCQSKNNELKKLTKCKMRWLGDDCLLWCLDCIQVPAKR